MKNGWRLLDFDDVLEDVTRHFVKIPTDSYQSTGSYAIVDQGQTFIAGYTDLDLPKNACDPPCIIFGDHTRIFKYVDFDFFIGADGVKVLKPKAEGDEKYFYHFLNSLKIESSGYSRHFKFLKRTRVLVPPLPEQKRIAAILDKADEIRRKREAAIAKLDQLAQSIFVEIFRDSIKSSVRIEMKDLIEEFRYGTSNKSGAFGYPALRIPNVAYGSLDLTELKTVEVSEEEFKRLKLLEGDLLFVRTNGNPEYVGRCVVFNPADVSDTRFNTSEYIYASYLIRARLKSFAVLPIVIQEFLSTAEGKQALRSRCKTSAGQFNINTESLGSLPIPKFPMPLQKSFIALKKSIEQQKIIHEKALTKQSQLFTTLQHQAFTGAL